MWDGVSLAKKQIISFMELVTIPIGVKLSVVKFMQRVVLVQSRSGSDPRVTPSFLSVSHVAYSSYPASK